MAIYAIGDVHGHYDALLRLLDKIRYNDSDELWFVGDLVNRGPDALAVLRFVRGLTYKKVVLGNHDFSLLVQVQHFPGNKLQPSTQQILDADDGEELVDMLRYFPLLHMDESLQTVMTHAGLFPQWTIMQGLEASNAVSRQLQSDNYREFLREIFGDLPNKWSANLQKMDYWRFAVNAFCRMRYLNADGSLNLHAKERPQNSQELTPWFSVQQQCHWHQIFGHWASLGLQIIGNVTCIDGGYAWGGKLAAYDVEHRQLITSIKAE
ncbi:MAG: symmetrical bis(5'-nucleosyl)-tetraphosphatase [Cardiobacteriaceae bacterium]|nr:symmetrical bis(5'-nucleosyl)-tetraphosphatase [Cardiobacteriaceae bacterium]